MIKKKDIHILMHLRKNARKKITKIAEEVKMPVTTVYDKVKNHLKKGTIKGCITLLEFSKLGMQTRMQFIIKVKKELKKELEEFLLNHPNVNTLYQIGFGYDFLFETIFKNFSESDSFVINLESKFPIEDLKRFYIVEELKKEEFLSKPEHFDIINKNQNRGVYK